MSKAMPQGFKNIERTRILKKPPTPHKITKKAISAWINAIKTVINLNNGTNSCMFSALIPKSSKEPAIESIAFRQVRSNSNIENRHSTEYVLDASAISIFRCSHGRNIRITKITEIIRQTILTFLLCIPPSILLILLPGPFSNLHPLNYISCRQTDALYKCSQ